jgi:hypothetical protein
MWARKRAVHERRERRRLAVMQRQRGALVFEEQAVVARGELREDVAQPLERGQRRQVPVQRAVGAAALQSVLPAIGSAKPPKQAVGVGHRASRDECDRRRRDGVRAPASSAVTPASTRTPSGVGASSSKCRRCRERAR